MSNRTENLSHCGGTTPAESWPAAGRALAVVLAALLCLGLAGSARGEIDAQQYRRDLQTITASPSRVVGSEGYYKTAQYIEEQVAELNQRTGGGVELQKHEYSLMVPVTESATITLAGGAGGKTEGKSSGIYPFWPAQIRLNATPAEGITGKLVYIGAAGINEIRPAEVMGQIAVMEASAGPAWTQARYYGAKAILVLGTKDTTYADLKAHEQFVPVNIPRFYLPAGELADALRKGNAGTATLQASVNWVKKKAVNYYALVQSPLLKQVEKLPLSAQWAVGHAVNPAPAGWEGSTPPGALLITVPFDSSSMVPDLSPGASQAVQTAAGLALLRELAARPLNRPVLVCFGGGDSIQMQGMRNMMMALADPPAMWRKLMQDVDEAQQAVTADLKRATVLQASPEKLDIVKDRSLIDRIVKIIETDSSDIQDKLFRLRIIRPEQMQTEAEKGAHKEALAGLEAEQIQLSALKFQFQQNPGQLTGDAPLAYMKRTLDRLTRLDKENGERRAALQRRVDLYCWLADRLQRNANPDERSNNSRLLELVVGLDLSDQGVRVGPMYFGQFQRTAHLANIQDFRDWLNKQVAAFGEAKPEAAWWGEVKAVIDLDPLTGSRSAASWLCAPLALPSEMCMNWGVPAFSMITLDDLRLRRDTPTDTLGHIDVDKILKQLSAVKTLLFNAWNAPKFKGPVEIRWQRNFLEGQVVSPAPGRPVPDLPREDFLATYYYCSGAGFMPEMRRVPWTLGVRRSEVVDSDAEGRYIFEGLGRGVQWDERWLIAQVYQVEKNTGEITSCSDMGNQAGDMSPYGDTFTDITPRHSVVFHCREFSLTGLYDPRFLQDLTELTPLDARRNDVPQRFNLILSNQMMAGFVEPDVSTHLLFRYGRVGNRLVLLNMQAPAGKRLNDPMDAARGFSVDQLNSLGPLALQTARDFWTLDALRLEDYRKAGVSSSLLDALQSEAASQLSQARDVYPAQRLLNAMGDPSAQRLLGMFRAQDAAELIDSANGAWARDARVYSAAKDMANDVIRAAIFLLLLCIPFSFCMERLVIGSTNVYKQIAWTFAIFAVMTAALWSFHPAFKISASPLIIILAFAIILMSLVVIGVIYGKFDTELKRLRSGRGTAATTSFARASVLMSAVLLGIANMRKRKFRTALTSITIILITFAVLCFTSASKYLDTTTLETGIRSQYEGIMLRQRGFRPLPEVTLQNLHAVLREHLRQHPQWLLVQRWWNANAADPREQYHVVASGAVAGESKPRVFAANAMLGLTPGESELNPDLASVIPNFARLEAGEERVIYLSKTTATVLKVKEGDKVQLGAIELEVAGLYDADQFDQKMLALSGDSICPVNYGATNADASGKALSYVGTEAFSLDADAASSELSGTYEHLSGNQIAVIPASVCRLMPNPSLRSVALRVKDDQEVKAVSSELSKRFAVAMFAGYKDGVKMVSASNLSSVSGAGQVAIPLAIAGLIIFNTMMGSIAERRREIHVYTSLGLAPVHVGALFVAEALTYGLIGTVFGYVIGQGVGTALLKLGWLGNVTLNYSGTSAMLTMGLILIIVLLSALVPARLASKIAAPSIERSWKVPLPKNDEIVAQLPFTINKTAAQGALAYLAEFFGAHQEGSIGKFSSGKVETFNFEDAEKRSSRGLKTVVWLTPFDLGVRQHLMLMIHPGQFEDIYEVQVVLQRLSGDDGSWYRMNRTFLTELRKQFLQWRSLSPQRMLEYVEESRKLFDEAKTQVVTTVPGEEVRLG